MIVLETERLVLRWVTADDAPFILRLVNEPSFIANIGDRGVRTLDDARGYIARGVVASYRQHGYGLNRVELRAGGVPIGVSGLVKRPFLPDPDIGFAFLPEYWSQGYALEAGRAVMAHGRGQLGIGRIIAIVSAGNEPSKRLLRKLGLEFDRVMDLPPPGGQVDLFLPAGNA